jgi:hypothetical protein
MPLIISASLSSLYPDVNSRDVYRLLKFWNGYGDTKKSEINEK